MSKKLEIDELGRLRHWQFAMRLYNELHFGMTGKYFVQIKLPKGCFLIGFFNRYVKLPFFMKVG